MRVEDMTIEQLLELNDIICQRIDELRARQELDILKRLTLGQTVSFNSSDSKVIGRVIKINRKTVVVQSADRQQWKVSVGMISQV